jgi:hypothetical protein
MRDAEIDYSDIPPLDKWFYTQARKHSRRRSSNSPSILTLMC